MAFYSLQVGTLDILVGLSDELGKLDMYCERLAFVMKCNLAF